HARRCVATRSSIDTPSFFWMPTCSRSAPAALGRSAARRAPGLYYRGQSEPNFPLLLVVSRLSRKRTLLCEPFEHAGDVHGEKPVS
ncbi:MAG: hypothetical protein WA712_26565, partial [Pseudolabrys sp.]